MTTNKKDRLNFLLTFALAERFQLDPNKLRRPQLSIHQGQNGPGLEEYLAILKQPDNIAIRVDEFLAIRTADDRRLLVQFFDGYTVEFGNVKMVMDRFLLFDLRSLASKDEKFKIIRNGEELILEDDQEMLEEAKCFKENYIAWVAIIGQAENSM